MIKYFIIEDAIGAEESEKEVNKSDFLDSLIYNLDEAAGFGDITTYQALEVFRKCYESINRMENIEAFTNGFIYRVEVVSND